MRIKTDPLGMDPEFVKFSTVYHPLVDLIMLLQVLRRFGHVGITLLLNLFIHIYFDIFVLPTYTNTCTYVYTN